MLAANDPTRGERRTVEGPAWGGGAGAWAGRAAAAAVDALLVVRWWDESARVEGPGWRVLSEWVARRGARCWREEDGPAVVEAAREGAAGARAGAGEEVGGAAVAAARALPSWGELEK